MKMIYNLYPDRLYMLNIPLKKESGGEQASWEFARENPWFVVSSIAFMVVMVILVVVILQLRNKRIYDTIAFKDPVTDIRNWNKFEHEVQLLLAKNTDKKYAFIQFDIDKFKTINDMYGLSGGNSILKFVAGEINALLRKDETMARKYADIFAVLIHYESKEDIIAFIEKVNTLIKQGTAASNFFVSFGVYEVEDNISTDLMSDWANMAKKRVKGNSVHYYSFYDKEIREIFIREKNIENEMEKALERGEFEVYLQPQYDLKTGEIVSAEALVRWISPKKGMISPIVFIDLFEKNSFILKLDLYVWQQVCKLIHRWIEEGREPVPISVNVSRLHISSGTLVQDITGLSDEYRIPAGYLNLEIVESMFLQNKEIAVQTVEELKEYGYNIAMDDFGSGYSSLNLLNLLPIDILKVDRGFLNTSYYTEKGKIIINDIISMSKRLSMMVVCEGVETKEQLEFLENANCDMVQGFYYAKPMPIIEFEKRHFGY